MSLKNWLKQFFLTEPQLVTGKRYIKWKRVGIVSGVSILSLMVAVAVFGQSSAQPDNQNYRPLSPDDVSKHGVMVLSGKPRDNSSKKSIVGSKSYASTGNSYDQGQVISRKDRAHGEYVLPAGSRISVVLDGELNSELSQSPVVAQLSSAFSFQGRTLFPAGTKVLGHVGQGQDSERIPVSFDQFVFPNGHQISVTGLAVMSDGSPGIVGDYHSNRGWKVAGALGSSFLAGASAAFQSTQSNMFGIQQPEGSTRNAILNGVAQTALEQGKRYGDEAQNSTGYVTIPSGTTFQVYIERETDLSGVLE